MMVDRAIEFFPIAHISRDDIKSKLAPIYHEKIDCLSDEEMKHIASKMGGAYLETGYWDDMTIIALDFIENMNRNKHNVRR